MKIFAIRDDEIKGKNLAYLFYYESDKNFHIEIPEISDEWELPLILSSLYKKGVLTVDSYWSNVWVQQRIVPMDRQNLGHILRDNGLDEYDEYALLVLADGRCAQDNCYIHRISETELPDEIKKRFDMRLDEVIPVADFNLLVFYRNGEVKKCDIPEITKDDRTFGKVRTDYETFVNVEVQSGGYAAEWGPVQINSERLYYYGSTIPLTCDDFRSIIGRGTVSASEAANMLNCSRQNVNDLVQRGKLKPIKSEEKNTLFLSSDIKNRIRNR